MDSASVRAWEPEAMQGKVTGVAEGGERSMPALAFVTNGERACSDAT
jgi:hypothetical protein